MCGNNGLVQAHRHKRENPGCGDQLPHHTTWSVEALRDELRGIDKAHSAARDICFTIFYSPSNEELVRRSIRSAQLGRPLKAVQEREREKGSPRLYNQVLHLRNPRSVEQMLRRGHTLLYSVTTCYLAESALYLVGRPIKCG